MSSIGYAHRHQCAVKGCARRTPYWSDRCKLHRADTLKSPRSSVLVSIFRPGFDCENEPIVFEAQVFPATILYRKWKHGRVVDSLTHRRKLQNFAEVVRSPWQWFAWQFDLARQYCERVERIC